MFWWSWSLLSIETSNKRNQYPCDVTMTRQVVIKCRKMAIKNLRTSDFAGSIAKISSYLKIKREVSDEKIN